MRCLQRPIRLRLLTTALLLLLAVPASQAQDVLQYRGADSRVDYAELVEIGPWDDRNYRLTQDDLDLLADNETELRAQIPAFFRVAMRKAIPEMQRTGPVQYPRSALQIFEQMYGGFLIDGKVYTKAEYRDGRYAVLMENGVEEEEFNAKFLNGEVRVTNPNGASESAIKINPVNTDLVIAGSNGPGSGQRMHFSTDGGDTWSPAAALPLGGTCCDPTVDWSSDGTLAYTATLGNCNFSGCQIWFYRSSDGGQTWDDLPGTPRRVLSTGNANDKEFIHVDQFATSPFKDNIYATWHSSNIMQFARSTDSGETWTRQAFSSAGAQRGIGSDITTDKNGDVYYFWPAFNSQRILLRKSTDGGVNFGGVIEVDSTEASFTFPVPSIETRDVFVYVSADTDLTNGPFAGSIYAAWTDSTGPTGNNPVNNHARIQVAYSRDGGNTWTVTTPHESADQLQVDRWHQWLSVGNDGTVHVIFYDTRRDPSRTSVDIFYSFSTDGAQSWSTPTRVTAEQSPNIADTFEFGDYNGLDIVMSDLIAIYTDNRNEGGGGGDSIDIYAAGIPVGGGGSDPIQFGGQRIDERIRTVNLSGFSNPIVVMGPPSFGGAQPTAVRVFNVTASSFQHFIDEWDYLDGNHVNETIGYLVLDAGTSDLGGLAAEAGSVSVNQGWTTVSFNQIFSSAPVVLAQVASNNDGAAVTTRVRNVTASSFQVKLQEEEAADNVHAFEDVHWIAVETGKATVGGNPIRVATSGDSVTHNFFTINFGAAVANPIFVGHMQTTDGGNTAALRQRNLSSTSIEVKVEEEQSADAEINHTTENVGYVLIGG
ncbi:MAG: hypothetical protein AAF657_23690 [Acidobacteriota bacterium]